MSRIGRQPITIPAGVNVEISDVLVKAAGPKGELEVRRLPGLKVEQADGQLTVSVMTDNEETLRTWGLLRTLISNIVVGVSEGFTRQLEINGVGYRASVSGNVITLALGFSHAIEFKLPDRKSVV